MKIKEQRFFFNTVSGTLDVFLVVLGFLNLEVGIESEMGNFTNNLCLFDFGTMMIPDHLYNSVNLNRKRFCVTYHHCMSHIPNIRFQQ